jgi:competence protein ComEC
VETLGGVPAPGLGVRLGLGDGDRRTLRPGDRIRAVARLARPRRATNPGDPGQAAAWARRGLHLKGWIERAESLVVLEAARGPLAAVATARHRAAGVLDAELAADDAGLARALVLGDRSTLANADRLRFRRTGQGHLIAVSGLHVGLLLAGLLGLLRLAGLGPRGTAALGLAAVSLYVPFAGARPSVVRAGSGAALYFAGRLLGRRARPAAVLAAVVVGVLVLEPRGLGDAALTLSVAAVLGILLLQPRLHALLVPPRPLIRGVVKPPRAVLRGWLSVSVAAWLGTAPLLASVLGRLCPLAAPFSLLTVPLTALLVGGAFLLLVVAPLPGAAPVAAWAFAVLADGLRWILDAFVALGLGTRPVSAPSLGWAACYVGAVLAARYRSRALALPFLLLALLFLPARVLPPDHPRVVLLDVGHGQAAVLLLPDGRAALLDAGRMGDPDVGRRVVVPALAALGVRELALTTVSHRDADHAGGMAAVHRALPVRRHVETPPPAGTVLLAGPWGRLVVASRRKSGADWSHNDASLVLQLETAAGRRMLFPGDLLERGAEDLLATGNAASVDVLLLPHHGLPGPGRERLLDALAPTRRLASCGRSILPALPPGTRATAREGALVVDLAPEGVTVRAPFALVTGGYDPAAAMPPPAPPPPDPATLAVLAGLLLLAFLSVRPFAWLRPAGAAAACALGAAAWLAFSAAGLAALLATFLVSTLLGRLPGAEREGARTLRQVAANGLVPLAGAVLALLGYGAAGWAAFLGGLACLGADTSATEIGTRYGGTPRSPVTGRPMRAGESGGVTHWGLVASVAGGALAPLAAWALGATGLRTVGLVALAGVAAALLDSVLGATLQFRGRDRTTGEVTEERAAASERVSGLAWLDNDAVNLVAALAGALLAVAFTGR